MQIPTTQKRRGVRVNVEVWRLPSGKVGAAACVNREGKAWGSRTSRRTTDRCGTGSGKGATAATKAALRALANVL